MPYIYSGRLDISNPNIRKQTPVGIYSTYPLHNRFVRSKELTVVGNVTELSKAHEISYIHYKT